MQRVTDSEKAEWEAQRWCTGFNFFRPEHLLYRSCPSQTTRPSSWGPLWWPPAQYYPDSITAAQKAQRKAGTGYQHGIFLCQACLCPLQAQ